MAAEDNSIEVNLHLIGNDELDRLDEIVTRLQGSLPVGGNLGSVLGGGGGSNPGQQLATTGTSQGVDGAAGTSRMPIRSHHLQMLADLPGGQALVNRLDWLRGFDESTGTYGNYQPGIGGTIARTLSVPATLATYGAIAPYAMQAVARPFTAVANFAGNIANSPSATFGAGLGYSTSGIFGTPIGSPAFNYGFMQRIGNPLLASTGLRGPGTGPLGLSNPFSTPGSIFNTFFGQGTYQGLIQSMQEFGYNANTPFGGQMNNALMGLGQTLGTSGINAMGGPSAVQSWLDPARYAGNSITGLAAQLKMLGDAAQASNMNVGQLREGIASAAQTIGEQTGAPAQAVNQQLLGLTYATGFGPSVTQGILGSSLLQNLAIAKSGGNIYQALYGPNSGRMMLGGLQMILGQLTGARSPQQLRAALQNPQSRNHIMNMLAWMYRSNPQALGGMRPEQVVQLMTQGHMGSGYQFGVDLSQAQTSLQAGHGITAGFMNHLFADASGAGLSQSIISHIQAQYSGNQKSEVSALASAMARMTGRRNLASAGREYVKIDLTDRAARALQVLTPATSSSNSNTMPPPAPYAAAPRLVR